MLVHQADQAAMLRQANQDQRDRQAHRESPDRMDHPVIQEHQQPMSLCDPVHLASPEMPDPRDLPDLQASQAKTANQDRQARRVPKVHRDHQVPMGSQDLKVHPANRDLRERRVSVRNIALWTEVCSSRMEQDDKCHNVGNGSNNNRSTNHHCQIRRQLQPSPPPQQLTVNNSLFQ